ncbi:MAG: hypothetical protein H3C57_00610 [Gammaproteobacteria bacterium]|nr:hypothetical protein [Gammaproteobacteria bacterium]
MRLHAEENLADPRGREAAKLGLHLVLCDRRRRLALDRLDLPAEVAHHGREDVAVGLGNRQLGSPVALLPQACDLGVQPLERARPGRSVAADGGGELGHERRALEVVADLPDHGILQCCRRHHAAACAVIRPQAVAPAGCDPSTSVARLEQP